MKKKKEIEAQIKRLYEESNADEAKKRELYMTKLLYSVIKALDSLKHLPEEMQII